MPTKFLDGPAQGIVLSLRRAPSLLRLVRSDKGEWDALDQLEDKPRFDETVHVYRLVTNDGRMHICGTKNGKRWGGYFHLAEYRLYEHQPDKATGLHKRLWQVWAQARIDEEMAAKLAAAEGGDR